MINLLLKLFSDELTLCMIENMIYDNVNDIIINIIINNIIINILINNIIMFKM